MLRAGVAAGHRRQILCSSTGSGKTMMSLRIIMEALKRLKRAWFVCDRTTLIDQTSETADRYGLRHGVIQADHWRRNGEPFQICSAQTLVRRSRLIMPDVLVVDECHTQLKGWMDIIDNDAEGKIVVVGLSATPFSKGLGKRFSNFVQAATMDELTRDGYLVPMRVFSCRKPDMTGAETSGGEWTAKAAEERELVIVGDVVQEWMNHGEGRKTIAFGATITHCEEMCRAFNAAGILAAVCTSKTDEDSAKDLMQEFAEKDSPLRVLISVEKLAKGYDNPEVSCVIDARPLRKSMSTFIQMIGRGLRIADGKDDCRILDFSGNIIRFAKDFEEFYYNGLSKLDDGEKLDSQVRKEDESFEPAKCPQCGHTPFVKRCVSCGHESRQISRIQVQPGVMQEITIGKKKAADSPEHLWFQIATYVKMKGKAETALSRARTTYNDIVGSWPPSYYGLDVPLTEPSSALVGKIRSRQIAYAKAMEKVNARGHRSAAR